MIIKKNFDMKIDLDPDMIASFFEECSEKNFKELQETAEKIDDTSLSYLAGFYLKKLFNENPEKFNAFVGTYKLNTQPKKEPKPVEEVKMPKERDVLLLKDKFGNWNRFHVLSVDEYTYILMANSVLDAVFWGKWRLIFSKSQVETGLKNGTFRIDKECNHEKD